VPNPCGGGAQCITNTTNGTYQCKCPPGTFGSQCKPDPCASDPCKRGSQCLPIDAGAITILGSCSCVNSSPSYVCVCQGSFPNFVGTLC